MICPDKLQPSDYAFKYKVFREIKGEKMSGILKQHIENGLMKILLTYKDHPCAHYMLEYILNDYHHPNTICDDYVGLGIASDNEALSYIFRKDFLDMNDIEERFKATPANMFKKLFGDKLVTSQDLEFFNYIFKSHI